LNELKAVFKNDPSITVYGGRGEAASLPTAVDEQIHHLREAYAIVQNHMHGLGDKESELIDPEKVEEIHYKNLQTEFEIAFPDYKLSYMTRNGLRACWECPGAETL